MRVAARGSRADPGYASYTRLAFSRKLLSIFGDHRSLGVSREDIAPCPPGLHDRNLTLTFIQIHREQQVSYLHLFLYSTQHPILFVWPLFGVAESFASRREPHAIWCETSGVASLSKAPRYGRVAEPHLNKASCARYEAAVGGTGWESASFPIRSMRPSDGCMTK